MSRTDKTWEAINDKLDELEDLITELPLAGVVRSQLGGRVLSLREEIQDVLDLTPTDW